MGGGTQSLNLSVASVLRRAGVQHPVQRTVALDELRVGEAVVAAGTPVDLDLVLEATGNAVVATGRLSTTARCECRRCLEPFDRVVEATVREIFEPVPVEGETYPLRAEIVALGPFIRDALLLALPLAPLCRDDCPGPAPERFPTGLDADAADLDAAGAGAAGSDADGGGADPQDRPRDPRWAALDQLQLDR